MRSATGMRLGGARVCNVQDDEELHDPEQCVVTGADGRFALEDASSNSRNVVASALHHISRRWPCDNHSGLVLECTIVLEPAAAEVSGTVIDATGGVVPGALVGLLDHGGVTFSDTITDTNGRFALPTPLGQLDLKARADGYSQTVRTIRSPASGVTLVLLPGATIPGRVEDADSGSALAGVAIGAASEDDDRTLAWATSDSSGNFELSGLEPGAYRVFVRDKAFWGVPERLFVGLGQWSTPVVLYVSAASSVRLTVQHEDGRACTNLSVFLSGAGAVLHDFSESGSLEFMGLAPGTYNAEVQCAGSLVTIEQFDLAAGASDHKVVVSTGIALTGRVERPSGERLEGAEVSVSPIGPPVRPAASCNTDDQGEFLCSGLSTGEHIARVMTRGEPASEPLRIVLEPSEAGPVVLKTFGLGTIRVSLPDRDSDTPLDIFVESERGIPIEATRDGPEFVFNDLPLGRYLVYANPADAPHRAEVNLERDAQVERVTLSLPESESIGGRVQDEHGVPVVDATVRALSNYSSSGEASTVKSHLAVTDSDGEFTIPLLARGHYDIRAESSLGDGEARGISTGNQSVTVTVLQNARLYGSVHEDSGAVASTFMVICEGADGFSRRSTGRAGRWNLGWVQPGTYRITASSSAGRATNEILLRPGEARELTLKLPER